MIDNTKTKLIIAAIFGVLLIGSMTLAAFEHEDTSLVHSPCSIGLRWTIPCEPDSFWRA